MLTPEELEKKKKREAELRWKKILAYYMMETYVTKAQARGVRFGRPPRPLPEGYHSAYQRWKAGKITGTAAARECGMPLSTFRYRAAIYEKSTIS